MFRGKCWGSWTKYISSFSPSIGHCSLQPADWLLSPAEDYVADDVTPVDWPLSLAQDDVADDVTPVDWPLSPAEDVIAADITPVSFCHNIMVAYCVLPKFEKIC